MASSSVSTTKNYDGRKATLTIEETSYSILDNTSTITWTLKVEGGSVNYYNAYEVAAYINGTAVWGPTSKTYDTKTFPAAKGTKTGTVVIQHKADGSADPVAFAIRGSFYNNNPATVNGTALTLTTIPRASSVSINSSNVTTNSSYTITVTPAVENTFSHILKYSFGNASGTIASLNTSTTSYSWQIPRSLAAQIPNSTESSAGALVITCETYNGSSLVGSKTCSCKLIVDSGIVPSLSSSSIQDGNATVRGKSWGIYLQNMSYVNINTMSGSGSQGSSIASYWCTFEGTDYSSTSLSGLNSQIQARGLPTTGNRTLQLWVVDSRGRLSTKASKSYTVVAYSSPSINSYDAYRSNSSGTATDDGTYFRYALNCSISSCNSKNPFTVNIRWKVKGSSTDTGSSKIKNAVTTEASYNNGGTLGGGNIGTNNTYEIIFEVSDAFSTITRSKDVGPAFELLHYHANGKAVAFGKKSGAGANEELFEVQMPSKMYDVSLLRNHSDAGFEWDIYGNWTHRRDTSLGSDDNWSIRKYNGDYSFRHYPENGFTKVYGQFHADGDIYSDGIGVNLTDVGYRFIGKSISNTNVNELNNNSLYYAGSGNSNMPGPGSWVELLTMGNGGQDAAQLGIYVSTGELYTRGKANGNWHTWRTAIMNEYKGTGVNLNDYHESGHYGLYGSNSNCPTESICTLEVIKYSWDWVVQRVTTVQQFPREWIRCFYSGTTWGTWGRVMHEKTIYESSGTNGNITLDYGLDNFDEIEIFYRDNGYGGISSKRFKADLYTLYRLDVIDTYTSGSTPHFEIRGCQYSVTNTTTLTRVSNQYFHVQSKTINNATQDSYLYVYRVVGYF